MHLSNNSSSVARSCWKKYYWRYIAALTPIRQSSSVTLGKVIHEAFDRHYKNIPRIDIIKYITSTFDDEINAVSPDEQEKIVTNKYTALGMFSNCPQLKTQYEKVISEMEFSVPLVRGNRYDQRVDYEGRIDGLIKKDGKWWIRELKTTGQTQRMFEQRISSSSQGTGYVYAARKLGYPVVGIIYDYVKRPLLRKRVMEDQYSFGNRILIDYAAKPEMYFKVIYSYRSDQELKLWEEDAINIVKELRKKKKNTATFYRNTDSCYNYNWECGYKKICFEEKPDPLMLQLYFMHDGKAIQ
jgi:hypothetical protein